jgi:hypothetical protein
LELLLGIQRNSWHVKSIRQAASLSTMRHVRRIADEAVGLKSITVFVWSAYRKVRAWLTGVISS